jgi:hypothetical protein
MWEYCKTAMGLPDPSVRCSYQVSSFVLVTSTLSGQHSHLLRCHLTAGVEEMKAEEQVPTVTPPAPASAKAKRKAALSKANAEGPKGGLLDAFTGPPPAAAQAQPETVKESPKRPDEPAATPAAPSPDKVSIPSNNTHAQMRL